MSDLAAMVDKLRKENGRLREALRREIAQSTALTKQYNLVLAERDEKIRRLQDYIGASK